MTHAITTKEAALICGLAPGTLAKWRVAGRGPRFIKVGKAVRYCPEDIERWLDASRRSSTRDANQRTEAA